VRTDGFPARAEGPDSREAVLSDAGVLGMRGGSAQCSNISRKVDVYSQYVRWDAARRTVKHHIN